MDEERFNMSLRKFLKKVGVTSQRELEAAVREAVRNGTLAGNETLEVKVTVELEGHDAPWVIEGDLNLE